MKDYLTSLREQYVDAVATTLRQVVREESTPDSSLAEMCNYHLDTGGKRLRATIPLAVADSLGADPESLIPFAAGCELLHNATLVHDDLQDGDDMRRNELSVWKKFGRPQAINVGDAMLFWALTCLDRLEVSDARYRECVERFTRQTLSVIGGQQQEFELARSSAPNRAEYLRMVEGKTGGLFVLTCAGAAKLSGASREIVESIETAARHLGVLFQIQDDILDLYGEKGRGERGADIREGKISVLVIHYLERESDERGRALLELLRSPRDEVSRAQIDRVAEKFRTSGALEEALDEIERRRNSAVEAVEGEGPDELRSLVDGLAELFITPIQHLH